ncbi:sensor histidine kinase [Homoserinimonas sp. A520]
METLAKERDRLLQRSSRMVGMSFSIVSLAIFLVPGVVEPGRLVAIVPLFIALLASLYFVAATRALPLVLGGIAAGLGIVAATLYPFTEPASSATLTAIIPLTGGGVAAFAMVLLDTRIRMLALLVAVAATAAVVSWTATGETLGRVWFITMVGWAMVAIVAYWLSSSIPLAARRIYSIGRAHRAERRASETEAQRRQSARLLHDTVLATLTLLAHSGVGVAPEAMRQQAADDARLLRQLRLGTVPMPSASGDYNLEPVEETALGTTLESVKQRFGRMGLEVSWHGTGQVLLPSDVLDAFLLALAECLENVRRHSGVTDAHVTITDDDTMIRAMVTDSGVGFDIKDVDEARLGLKDSVVGRLKEVGGSARLFSAAGAGTTVVLEVPRA